MAGSPGWKRTRKRAQEGTEPTARMRDDWQCSTQYYVDMMGRTLVRERIVNLQNGRVLNWPAVTCCWIVMPRFNGTLSRCFEV